MTQTLLEREDTEELREEPEHTVQPTVAAPTRRRRLPRRAAAIAVAVALTVVAGIAVLETRRAGDQARRADRLAAAASTRQDAQIVAGEFATALLSYDFGNLDAARQRVLDLSTDTFDATYTEAFNQGLGPVITQLQASATATVRDVYATDISGDTAKAVVVLNSEVKSTAGVRQLVDTYLQIELARQNGTWLVNKVTPIAAFGGDTLTPPPAPAQPPTDPPAG